MLIFDHSTFFVIDPASGEEIVFAEAPQTIIQTKTLGSYECPRMGAVTGQALRLVVKDDAVARVLRLCSGDPWLYFKARLEVYDSGGKAIGFLELYRGTIDKGRLVERVDGVLAQMDFLCVDDGPLFGKFVVGEARQAA